MKSNKKFHNKSIFNFDPNPNAAALDGKPKHVVQRVHSITPQNFIKICW